MLYNTVDNFIVSYSVFEFKLLYPANRNRDATNT